METFIKIRKNKRVLKQSHSAEKLEMGDPLGFLKLQFAEKYQKNLKGDKKIRKKVAQCRKKFKGGPCSPVRLCIFRLKLNTRKGGPFALT